MYLYSSASVPINVCPEKTFWWKFLEICTIILWMALNEKIFYTNFQIFSNHGKSYIKHYWWFLGASDLMISSQTLFVGKIFFIPFFLKSCTTLLVCFWLFISTISHTFKNIFNQKLQIGTVFPQIVSAETILFWI